MYVYVCVCKQDLALNNPQGLICHKTQPNQTKNLFSGLNVRTEIEMLFLFGIENIKFAFDC